MEHNTAKPKRHTLMASKLLGLSLKRDDSFVYNIIVTLGTVFVRGGMRGLLDKYRFKQDSDWRYFVSIGAGIVLLFLLDGSLEKLGGYKKVIEETKETILGLKTKEHNDNESIDHKSVKK